MSFKCHLIPSQCKAKVSVDREGLDSSQAKIQKVQSNAVVVKSDGCRISLVSQMLTPTRSFSKLGAFTKTRQQVTIPRPLLTLLCICLNTSL